MAHTVWHEGAYTCSWLNLLISFHNSTQLIQIHWGFYGSLSGAHLCLSRLSICSDLSRVDFSCPTECGSAKLESEDANPGECFSERRAVATNTLSTHSIHLESIFGCVLCAL